MQTLADDDYDDTETTGQNSGLASQQPAWTIALSEKCREWLTILQPVSPEVFTIHIET